ncbi:MAG: alkaline phosphatase family protein, partial [Geminicoccaceae bacterium]|nr:alkaline phosphatase family protein [Geminicoccaceae bacterium]
SPRRVLLIGLEAIDPKLVRKWSAEGHLPVMKGLIERGSWSVLGSTVEIGSGASWGTLITGTNPGKHGMAFYHRQLRAGTYEVRKKYADGVGCEPFWARLGEAGRRLVVFDVPTTYPLPDMPGVQVCCWGSQAENWEPASSPPGLIDEIVERFGKHPTAGWYEHLEETPEGVASFLDTFLGGIRTRTDIAVDLAKREDWDFFFAVFPEVHTMGHLCWHIHDATDPDHDPELAAKVGDPMLKGYKELDTTIGRLIEAAPPDAVVAVVSNSGMGSHFTGIHMVPEILKRAGLSADAGGKSGGGLKKALRRLTPQGLFGANPVRKIEQLVGPGTIVAVRRLVPRKFWDRWTRKLLMVGSGWAESKAFPIINDSSAAIRINLQGREPRGRVKPEEYDSVIAQLEQIFSELINPATGEPAVRKIIKSRQAFNGSEVDELPDFCAVWNRGAPIERLHSPTLGDFNGGELPDRRSGAHTYSGFILLAGEGIERHASDEEEGTLDDIGPTVLELLGVPVPPYMDGRPMIQATTRERVAEPAYAE